MAFPIQVLAFVVTDLSWLLFHATFDRLGREASIKLRNFRPPLKERSGAWCEYSYLGQILHELDKPRMIYAHV